MDPVVNHHWSVNEDEAKDIQLRLAKKVILKDTFPQKIGHVAGVDVAYKKDGDRLIASIVVMEADTLRVVETVVFRGKAEFPYIPGLFSFRELPPIIKVFSRIKTKVDLVVCDGHGLAHPRRFGLACHLGVLFDIPTIGCGKTNLVGKTIKEGKKRGETLDIIHKNDLVGRVLWTQTKIKPVYVSVGHRISLTTACKWILHLAPKYRLPETTRLADQAGKREP